MRDVFDTIKAVQAKLGLEVDGLAGRKTWDAIAEKLGVVDLEARPAGGTPPSVAPVPGASQSPGEVDARSEKNIATLLPIVQGMARDFLFKVNHQIGPFVAKIISGSRTYAEQDALFAQGGVTKARGGYSNHNFGIAFDIGIFAANGQYLDDHPLYDEAGAIGKSLGWHWGGDWHSFQDKPHFEWHPSWAANLTENAMLAELRARNAKGQAIA